ncbi:hypothetical protein ACRC7T_16315 [Segnochrobactraceae bacterium EtOH-i3]
MKRPLRPFLVEVKRTKRPVSSPLGTLELPEEHAPASSSSGPATAEQELIARIFSGIGNRPKSSSVHPARPVLPVEEDAERGPRILESLAPVVETVSEPDVEEEAPLEEEEAPFGWLVHRGADAPRSARPRRSRDAAAAEEADPSGFVVKPRRGRPPRSAASAPRVLDPSAWPEELAPARPRHEAVTAPTADHVEAEAAPVRRGRGRPRRVAPVELPAAPVKAPVAKVAKVAESKPAPSAPEADKEAEGRRRIPGRRRGAGGELPAGQRWKKRLPKVLW